MERREVFVTNKNNSQFRYDQKAKIIGVEMVTPSQNDVSRLCCHLKWSDGVEEWIPFVDCKFDYETGDVVG